MRRRRCCSWTAEELRFLRTHAGKVPLDEICCQLGRQVGEVCRIARLMRLSLQCPYGRRHSHVKRDQ